MTIIQREPNESGAYPPMQPWAGLTPPEGYVRWLESVDTAEFYAHSGFVILHIVRDTVESYDVNSEAEEAWKAEHPEPEPEPIPAQDVPTWEALAEAIKGGVDNAE